MECKQHIQTMGNPQDKQQNKIKQIPNFFKINHKDKRVIAENYKKKKDKNKLTNQNV